MQELVDHLVQLAEFESNTAHLLMREYQPFRSIILALAL